MADPLISMVLPRRYRVMSLLGRGSTSVVYKGTYEPLDQLVAIKMLKSHLVSDPHQAKRFQQEIKTVGSLNHPNIVGILDFGVTEQGVPYLVMEYLEGLSLADMIEKEERVSVNRAIKIFSQAADALAYAHAEGVIHRDIKPSNLVVVDTEEERDVVKIVDFGIAKVVGSANSNSGGKVGGLGLTATGEVLGTPLYMSPEQANGRELDGRSDIYALGCVMYHAITGKPPFVGDTAIDTIRLQISGVATPIDQARPDLFFPERLQSVINKALQKDPRARYQRMEHLKADIDSCGRKSDIGSPNQRVSRALPAIEIEYEPSAQTSVGPLKLRLTLPVLSAIIAAVIVIAVGGWAVLTDGGKKQQLNLSMPLGSEAQWRQALDGAQAAYAAAQYNESAQLYKEALTQANKFSGPDPRQAVTLSGLAAALIAMDNLDEAQKDCKLALKIYEQTNPNDPARAEVLTNLAKIYCSKNNLTDAEWCANEALKLRQDVLGPTHHEVAASLQALAAIRCQRGNYKQADELLVKAQAIAEKSMGKDNADLASILHDLAVVREKEGNYANAEELFNRALGIRQKYLGVEHPAVADTLCALGRLEFNVRKDASAETMFNNALAIRKKAFGDNSPRVAEVYSSLAVFYDDQKRFDKAEDCYRKAVETRSAIYGNDSAQLLPSLEALARFLRRHNQSQGAEVYENQINEIRKRAHG